MSQSEFCQMAHRIYQTWKQQGENALYELFTDELGIPEKDAERFVRNYNPSGPPSEVCPVDALDKRMDSSVVFRRLSLQLPSRNDSKDGVWPKNVLAWWVLRTIYGSDVFDFEIKGSGTSLDNRIEFPNQICTENGENVPLGLAALEAVEVEDVPAHVVRKSKTLQQHLGREVGLDLTQTLVEAAIEFPPKKCVEMLAAAVERGLRGETVVITGAFCPDYEYEATGDPLIPYRYTFNGLNSGVGLVAQQFRRMLPYLTNFLEKHGIDYQVHLGIGDFEAESEAIRKQVGVSYDDFIGRCQESLEAFRRSLPKIPMQLYLLKQDLMNGYWEKYQNLAYMRMVNGDFGYIRKATGKDPVTEVVNFVAKSSRRFYERWFGRTMTEQELRETVISQGAEYAAVGKYFRELFNPAPIIQLAGDRPKMQAFNNFWSWHPTLCAKRTY